MVDFIKIQTTFRDDPKTILLQGELGGDGIASLIFLWIWTAQHRNKGKLEEISDAMIERVSQWYGEPGKFVSALLRIGFMIGDENHREIHNWKIHNEYAYHYDDIRKANRKNAIKSWLSPKRGEHQKSAPEAEPEEPEPPEIPENVDIEIYQENDASRIANDKRTAKQVAKLSKCNRIKENKKSVCTGKPVDPETHTQKIKQVKTMKTEPKPKSTSNQSANRIELAKFVDEIFPRCNKITLPQQARVLETILREDSPPDDLLDALRWAVTDEKHWRTAFRSCKNLRHPGSDGETKIWEMVYDDYRRRGGKRTGSPPPPRIEKQDYAESGKVTL